MAVGYFSVPLQGTFHSSGRGVLLSSCLLAVTSIWEEVGGKVPLQQFSVQYAIALASVSKFTASTAGMLSSNFSMVQGRLSESSKKSSKLKSKGELGPTAKAIGLQNSLIVSHYDAWQGAAEVGSRAAAREFEIDESMNRYWKKKKDVMTKLPKRQRTCRTGLEKFPALERTLKDWVVSQRENSRAVTTVMIRLKAKELAKQINVTEFVGGPSWCNRFRTPIPGLLWARSCQVTGRRRL